METERCEECRGTGREVDVEEIYDDDEGLEVIAEIPHDFGPCEICEGRGWFAVETPDQQQQRVAQERAERLRRHVETATAHGYFAACPFGCPEATRLWRVHVEPGGVHDTRCADRCIGY